MTIPQVLNNEEDFLTPWQEKYAAEQIQMKPYHFLMTPATVEDFQYPLMTPFTPSGKDNMVAWFAVKSEFSACGEIIRYNLPKDRFIYGPNQIESMID